MSEMGEEDDKDAINLEKESVHRVYDIIAGHFSDTRYKVTISVIFPDFYSPGP